MNKKDHLSMVLFAEGMVVKEFKKAAKTIKPEEIMRKKNKKKIDEAYILEEAKKIKEEDIHSALNSKKELEDKMSKSGLLKKYLTISKLIWRMLNDYRKGEYKDVPWMTISSMAFTLLYVVNPMDLIPDFIPLIGYLDDLTVLALALNLVENDIKKYLDWKDESQELG